MIRYLLITLIFSATILSASGQDTFSIIAIDTVTGEIGSAGASCIAHQHPDSGVIIISSVFPGKGVIHTQAQYHPKNQKNAIQLFNEGKTPSEIISWLRKNDISNRIESRQYMIARISNDKKPSVAAFTGVSCNAYKNHIIGKNYCIAGNILAGHFILDSMEQAFLRKEGTLDEKIMAALKAAKIPGADTRCLSEGISSKSAFIRMAKPGDSVRNYFLQLNVNNHPKEKDPIDILEEKYRDWKRRNQRE